MTMVIMWIKNSLIPVTIQTIMHLITNKVVVAKRYLIQFRIDLNNKIFYSFSNLMLWRKNLTPTLLNEIINTDKIRKDLRTVMGPILFL